MDVVAGQHGEIDRLGERLVDAERAAGQQHRSRHIAGIDQREALAPHRELGRGQRFGEVEGELVVSLLQRQLGGFDLGVRRIAEHPVAFDVSGVQRSVELQDGRARVEEGEATHPFTERSFPLDVVHEEPARPEAGLAAAPDAVERVAQVECVERPGGDRLFSARNSRGHRQNPEARFREILRVIDAEAVDLHRLVELLVVVAAPAVLPLPGGNLPGHLTDSALCEVHGFGELERLVALVGHPQPDAAHGAARRRFDSRRHRNLAELRELERTVEDQFDVLRFRRFPIHFHAFAGRIGVVGRSAAARNVFFDSGIQSDRESGGRGIFGFGLDRRKRDFGRRRIAVVVEAHRIDPDRLVEFFVGIVPPADEFGVGSNLPDRLDGAVRSLPDRDRVLEGFALRIEQPQSHPADRRAGRRLEDHFHGGVGEGGQGGGPVERKFNIG